MVVINEPVPWSEFEQYWRRNYKQDQHVTVIGPTGSGKTTLVTELIKPRGFVIALGVKHKDKTLSKLEKTGGWYRVQDWKKRPKSANRIIVWPKEDDLDKVIDVHRKVFSELFRSVFKIGHWTLWIDELTYLTDHVGLRKQIRSLYILARSNLISLVGVAQRPAHIPLEAYSQSSHLFLYRTGDERDLARVGGLNGVNAKQVANTVAQLPMHYFLYVNLTNGDQMISTVPREKT